MTQSGTSNTTLKRSLGLPLLVCYGLGTILGAGIYVLIAEVGREAGIFTPLSFALAAILATFTAFSYAELSARFPVSAGEAYYVQQVFSRRWLSSAVGYLVVLIAIVSSATISNGFAGYLNVFFSLPDWLTVLVLVLVLGLIAAWGITESVILAAVITVVEIGGLLLVIWLGRSSLVASPELLSQWPAQFGPGQGSAVLAGAFIAFYAFIGFEDMVNVAEEVVQPSRNLPLAIVITLVVSTCLYLLVALVAVTSLPMDAVTSSRSPLADMVKFYQPGLVPLITVISLLAVVNGALIQIIKGSRVFYGMAKNAMAPQLLARVSPRTRTPLLATALCTALVAVFALALDLVALARLTSFITLLVFTIVNSLLLVLKLRGGAQTPHFKIPILVPVAGILSCLLFIANELFSLPWLQGKL
jgi:APA family basic amino acid/polyamine antiporter